MYDGAALIGVGRALADELDCSYICDIADHPEHQGNDPGKAIVKKLVALSEGHNKTILYANPGKEEFYNKLGFKKMKTVMAIFIDQEHAIDTGLVG